MGSFYSTCSISHTTLKGDSPTSILLLSPTAYSGFSEHKRMILSNSCPQAFFSPFAFPIHGKYDDYGYIDNIKRDKNVEMLEQFFNISIEDIICNIGDKMFLMTYETRDKLYDENRGVETLKEDELLKKVGLDGKDMRNKKTFLMLSMTYMRTEVLEYLESGWDTLIKREQEAEYSFTRAQKIIESLSIKREQRLNELHELEIKLWDELDKHKEGSPEHEKLKEKQREVFLEKFEMRENSTYTDSQTLIDMFNVLPINSDDFHDEILKQYQFLINLDGDGLNRVLMPSNYGMQEDNWVKTLKLNRLVNKIIQKDWEEDLPDMMWGFIDENTKEFDKEGFVNLYGEFPEEILEKAYNFLIKHLDL